MGETRWERGCGKREEGVREGGRAGGREGGREGRREEERKEVVRRAGGGEEEGQGQISF
jgi:hypothetical protein